MNPGLSRTSLELREGSAVDAEMWLKERTEQQSKPTPGLTAHPSPHSAQIQQHRPGQPRAGALESPLSPSRHQHVELGPSLVLPHHKGCRSCTEQPVMDTRMRCFIPAGQTAALPGNSRAPTPPQHHPLEAHPDPTLATVMVQSLCSWSEQAEAAAGTSPGPSPATSSSSTADPCSQAGNGRGAGGQGAGMR